MIAMQGAETFGPMFPEMVPVFSKMLLQATDGLDPETKKAALQLCDLKIDSTVSGLMAMDKGAQTQVVQSEMMLQQMMQQMQGGGQPQGQEQAPQEGQPMPESETGEQPPMPIQ